MIRKFLPFIIIFFLGLIPLFDLFQPGLPITHDGQDHVARIANFYKNLSEGNFIPRWAPNLNWGFGHPILMFLYPLPSYFASFFHLLGFGLVDSLKIVFGATYILSGIFMLLWLRSFLPQVAAFTGAFLYMFAPYRFVDLYVRGAIGEHVAFMFLPLVLYFVFKITKDKNIPLFLAGGALSLAGLILSHNAISLMFLPFIFLYILYLFFSTKSVRFIYRSFILFALGFGLASFFWIPAFFEGKYTLRDIVTDKDYALRFVNFKDFIYGSWSYGISGQFSPQVGLPHWIFALVSFVLLFVLRKKSEIWKLTVILLIVFILSLFLMHSSSKLIWDNITTLQKFQFPWRFLSLTVFAASVLSALVVSQIPKKYKTAILTLVILITLFLNKDYWHAKDFLLKSESFFTGVYNSTTDTGESAPIWSVRFMEKRPKAHIEVISGNADIEEAKRTSTFHEYRVNVSTKIRLRENTLYFPGWSVFVDGKMVDLEFQDPSHRGLMTFFVEPGEHGIIVRFEETKLRSFSNYISIFSLIGILGIVGMRKFRIKV